MDDIIKIVFIKCNYFASLVSYYIDEQDPLNPKERKKIIDNFLIKFLAKLGYWQDWLEYLESEE